MSDEMPVEKRCSKCGEMKPVEEFYKKGGSRLGYESQCKACKNQRFRQRYANDPELRCKRKYQFVKMTPTFQAYMLANAEKLRVKRRFYYNACLEKSREWQRNYRQANLERIRQRESAYYASNNEYIRKRRRIQESKYRDRTRAHNRAYCKSHPDVYATAKHRRRAHIKDNGGSFTAQQIREMRAAQNGICAYCGQQHDPRALTIDHIIPLTQDGSNDISNICLACRSCNCSKKNRTPEQWVNRWYERKPKDSENE